MPSARNATVPSLQTCTRGWTGRVKAILDVRCASPAQMVDDIRLAINDRCPIETVPARRRRDHGTQRGHGCGQETAGTIRRRRTWKSIYERKGIQPDMVDGFCPGCMHSTLFKLIGEYWRRWICWTSAPRRRRRLLRSGHGILHHDYLLAAHGRSLRHGYRRQTQQSRHAGVHLSGRRRPGSTSVWLRPCPPPTGVRISP